MGSFALRSSAVTAILGLLGCSFLTSCSSSSATQVSKDVVPAIVKLTPAGNVSLEVGKIMLFTASATNGSGTALAETFLYQSTAPNIVTVADNGLACAGTWDSLTLPSVCTPGPTGVAEVTAVATGVPSPPVTVYVHDHVTSVVIQQVPGQPPTLSTSCFSKGAPAGPESVLYQAFAYDGSTDITSSVGPFTWQNSFVTGQALTGGAVTLTSAGVTAPLNEEIAQANNPGSTFIFASVGGVNSQPLSFTTCPVQSIVLTAQNNSGASFVISSGTSMTLNATVKDTLGMPLAGLTLQWSSSDPLSVGVAAVTSTVYGSTGTITSPAAGSASVTASCTPPSCNGGIMPSMPIYPPQAINFTVKPNATLTTNSPTVYVTSTGCRTATTTCTTQVVPLTRSSSTAPFAPGTPVALPAAPNSAQFDHTGAVEYFGADSTALGTRGAVAFSGGATAQPIAGVAGKILAVSPDGSMAIFSDTVDSPQQILICLNCSTGSGSGSGSPTRLLLCDPTKTACSSSDAAAAFSPDSLKAYIVTSNPCPGTTSAGCLLVYSKLDAPRYVQLAAPASGVSFIGDGILGYLAGGNPAGAAFLPTCIVPSASGLPGGSGVSSAAQFLLPLPDGQSVLALDPPNLETITAGISGTSSVGASGCPAPRGFLNITNTVTAVGNLGVGGFTPSQFFLSSDGTMAYVLGAPSLPYLIQFNLTTGIPFEIALAGNATPVSASLSPASDLLFVGATDGSVHVINTSSLADIQQVTLPFPQNSMCIGPGTPVTQVQTALSITSATQSGTSTTYSYDSLTGPALQTGETVLITGMVNFGNNGRFTISALGSSTLTVTNANGVTASGQNGTGISGTICLPDLVAVKP